MGLSKALQKFVEEAKTRDSYWVEQAKLDFSLALESRRKAAGLTYAAIAKLIGTSAAYITKVFRGDSNLTIESMVKLARVTGGHIKIEIVDEQVKRAETETQPNWGRTIVMRARQEAANHSSPPLRTRTGVSSSPYTEDVKQAA